MTHILEFYKQYGLTVYEKLEGGQIVADCPVCNKSKHTHICPNTGMWHCKVCHESGNPVTFLKIARPSMTQANIHDALKTYNLLNDTAREAVRTDHIYPVITGISGLTPAQEKQYCEAKHVELIALKKLQAKMLNGCVVFPARRRDLPKGLSLPCGWVRDNLDGTPVQIGDGEFKKYPVVKNSVHGLLGFPQLTDGRRMVKHDPNGAVLLCEGVRDTLRALSLGFTAFCTSGGAGFWHESLNAFFKDANIFIIYDRDNAGVSGAAKIAAQLAPVALSVRVVELPYEVTESHGKDLSDYLDEGHDKEAFILLMAQSKLFLPPAKKDIPQPGRSIDEVWVVPDSTTQSIAKKYLEHIEYPIRHHQSRFSELIKDKYILLDHEVLEDRIIQTTSKMMSRTVKGRAGSKQVIEVPVDSTVGRMKNTMTFLRSHPEVSVIGPEGQMPPFWLSAEPNDPPAHKVIAFQNCLVDCSGEEPRQMELTSRFFTYHYVPCDYDPEAKSPVFDQFICDKFTTEPDADDPDDIGMYDETAAFMLQEYCGLCLTADTSFHKMLMLIGRRRSGKGTLLDILGKLIGDRNIVTTSTHSLCNTHGLEPFIGKTVAMIRDADSGLALKNSGIASEVLKNITGEDPVTINPKNKSMIAQVKLPIRFIISANQLTVFHDVSAVIGSRMLFVVFHKSFLGNEDRHLKAKLSKELSGIANWAMLGYMRLVQRGHFLESHSSKSYHKMYDSASSPIAAFTEECLVFGRRKTVASDLLYKTYVSWCMNSGISPMSKVRLNSTLCSIYTGELTMGRRYINNTQCRCIIGCGISSEASLEGPPQVNYSHESEDDNEII